MPTTDALRRQPDRRGAVHQGAGLCDQRGDGGDAQEAATGGETHLAADAPETTADRDGQQTAGGT